MPQRQHRSEMHNGHHLNASAVRSDEDGKWRSEVDVRSASGALLPYAKEDGATYDNADQALEAAIIVGRTLAEERPNLPDNA